MNAEMKISKEQWRSTKGKGQYMSEQNCRAINSPKKQTNKIFFYSDDSEIET